MVKKRKSLLLNKKTSILLFSILFLSSIISIFVLASSDDVDVVSCTEKGFATCNAVSNFNDGNIRTIGAIVGRGGIIHLAMGDVSEATNKAAIESVKLSLYHGGQSKISGAWVIQIKSEDGTLYCEDNTISHKSGRRRLVYWDLTYCTNWTKAKLNDLRIEMISGDGAGSQDAYVYELDIDVSYSKTLSNLVIFN